MTLLAAIQRIQNISEASTDITIKFAPDAPVTDAAVSPFTIAYIGEGQFEQTNATDSRFRVMVNLDVYFNTTNMPQAFKNMDLYTYEFLRRLGGDPTLDGNVQTIIFPIIMSSPTNTDWNGTLFLRKTFNIPIHTLETPLTTST